MTSATRLRRMAPVNRQRKNIILRAAHRRPADKTFREPLVANGRFLYENKLG